jgi:tRNA1Val (adenine37-N6)-methyltransferase
MPNDYFEFKQFRIEQDKCAMKVGTDSVVLGSWTPVENIKSIVDLGSGSGLLSLMMAQRTKARISSIEIDMDAALQSAHNYAKSPWPHLIEGICGNIAELKNDLKSRFDLAICNPPYFAGHFRPDNSQRTTARHIIHSASSGKSMWLEAASAMTHELGKASFIIPLDDEAEWMHAAESAGWNCSKKLVIYGNPTSKPKRCILYLSKQKAEMQVSELIIESEVRGVYTSEFKELASPFYLNL